MTLDKMETAWERRQIIRYGHDGNTAIRLWCDVRLVTGTLYMSAVTTDRYGDRNFDIFLFFPGVEDGLFLQTMRNPEECNTERLLESAKRGGLESRETFIACLDTQMAQDAPIGNITVAFVSQWNPEKAAVYAEYRAARLARQEEKERQEECQRRMEEEGEEAREKAEAEARLKAEKAGYLGWADAMTPVRYGKVNAVLSVPVRCDGKVMARREFVIQKVQDGWMPERKEGVIKWYGSKWERKQSKPKTEYTLAKEDLSYEINKTEFDFAVYLVKHSKP